MAYTPYNPYAAEAVRPLRGAAIAAVVALGLNALILNVLAVLATVRLIGGDGLSEDALAIGALLQLLPILVAAVGVIVWLWIARTNADVVNELPEGWGRPWVIFGWVVPIVSFWIPRSIVGGVWFASAPSGRSMWPVNAWWAAWLVYLIGNRVANLDPDDGFQSVLFPFIAETGAFAALLAMLVIWRITEFQEAHAVRLREAIAWGDA